MDKLASLYRSAQLYTHNAHNAAHGPTFLEDHEFLGELYPAYESAYDSLVERMIQQGAPVDFSAILANAVSGMNGLADPALFPDTMIFAVIQNLERQICAEIDAILEAQTTGTQNLLAGLADESEMRQYKVGQRIKP